MSRRLLALDKENVTTTGASTFQIHVTPPSPGNLAPSGNYLLYFVHKKNPSEGIWVQMIGKLNKIKDGPQIVYTNCVNQPSNM